MQRVATELHTALLAHPAVDLSSIVMRSSWKWTHVKTGPFLAFALWRIKKQADSVDVVLFSSMVSAALAVFLRDTFAERGVLSAAIVHGRDVTLELKPYQTFVPRIFEALDAVLPVSRATGEACAERGLSEEKLFVVPNGVSVPRFRGRSDPERGREALAQRFGDAGAGLLLCSVGRQVKRKGFDWFVEHAMPLLPSDVQYWLVGDGPEAENIRSAAKRAGVDDRIRLLGRVSESDLQLVYNAADLFIMPNVPVQGDMEGFGVVLLEAGLSGLPTIAARLEGIMDVIREGENGHLVPSGEAWAFSEAIMRYYRSPEQLATARSRAAAYVESNFSWRAVADRYVEVLEAAADVSAEGSLA